MKKKCPICLNIFARKKIIRINKYTYINRSCLKELIYRANLGIDIWNASLEEWVITAENDKLRQLSNNEEVYRLRNPINNIKFSEGELKIIYNKLML